VLSTNLLIGPIPDPCATERLAIPDYTETSIQGRALQPLFMEVVENKSLVQCSLQ